MDWWTNGEKEGKESDRDSKILRSRQHGIYGGENRGGQGMNVA